MAGTAAGAAGGAQGPEIARVSVLDFGAKGDGQTDDSAAFQAALDSLADVVVPPTRSFYRLTRTLATRRSGQRLSGEGDGSHVLQTGSDENATVINVAHPDCTIADLRITPGRVSTSLYHGWAVAVSAVTGATVERCRCDVARRGGVLVFDATDCVVRDNRFAPLDKEVPARQSQARLGFDVLVAGNAHRHQIAGNSCVSGCGVGIGCQTVSAGKLQSGVLVQGNSIRGHPCYGIMAYLSGDDGQIVGLAVIDNMIEAISGTVSTADGLVFYGAGIYVQTCNDFVISGNLIRETNSDRHMAFSGGAVPAAIAISGCANGIVSGNMIRNCIDGIASIQATRPVLAGEGTVIANNVIVECDRIGVNLTDCASATVRGNRLTGRGGGAAHGVFVHRGAVSPEMRGFSIEGNQIENFHAGIEVDGAEIRRAIVHGNLVSGNRGYGIACSAQTTIVTDNIVHGAAGIALAPAARRGWCRGNVIDATGVAMIDDAGSGVMVRDNLMPDGPGRVSTGLALPAATSGLGKAFRLWTAGDLRDLGPGFEGEQCTILTRITTLLVNGGIATRGRVDRTLQTGEVVGFIYLDGQWREAG